MDAYVECGSVTVMVFLVGYVGYVWSRMEERGGGWGLTVIYVGVFECV
jgi:hypothetical protein